MVLGAFSKGRHALTFFRPEWSPAAFFVAFFFDSPGIVIGPLLLTKRLNNYN